MLYMLAHAFLPTKPAQSREAHDVLFCDEHPKTVASVALIILRRCRRDPGLAERRCSIANMRSIEMPCASSTFLCRWFSARLLRT